MNSGKLYILDLLKGSILTAPLDFFSHKIRGEGRQHIFRNNELSLKISWQIAMHSELLFENLYRLEQKVSRKCRELSLKHCFKKNLFGKPRKERNFVRIQLHYFCTILNSCYRKPFIIWEADMYLQGYHCQ